MAEILPQSEGCNSFTTVMKHHATSVCTVVGRNISLGYASEVSLN